jgi:hypothetical protein
MAAECSVYGLARLAVQQPDGRTVYHMSLLRSLRELVGRLL